MRSRWLAVVVCAVAGCGGSNQGSDPDAPAGTADAPVTPPDGTPPAAPRLVIADAGGALGLWALDAPLTDRAPDVTLVGLDGAPRAVVARGDRLIVVTDGADYPVAIYDNVSRATSGAGPDVLVSAADAGVSRLGAIHQALVDAAGNLWLLEGFGRVDLIRGGALGTPTGTAQFVHPWDQLAAITVIGDRLFAGQISGAGLVVWDGAAARSGLQDGGPDWQLADVAAWALVTGGDRLYALDASPPATHLAVWDDASALTAPHAADVVVSVSSAQAVGDLAWRDNALAMVIANGVTENRVAIFADSAAVTPTSEPDHVVAPAAADYLQRSYLDASGRLFVLDTDGVYAYADVLTAPAPITKLTALATPVAMAVIE